MEMKSFEEFWPYYVGEHRSATTRAFHYFGTSIGLPLGIFGIATMNPALIPLGLVLGYGPAWISHFFIEKIRPATFKHPLWSFLGDLKMLSYGVTGRMGDEFARLEKSSFRFVPAAA